jgi:NAD(P)H dehydrogenase (quinone)
METGIYASFELYFCGPGRPRVEKTLLGIINLKETEMYVLVLYYSRGGNTRKLAEQVAEGIRSVAGVEAVLKSTQEVTKEDFTGAAGIVAGSPVYFGVMAADLKRIFDEFVGIRSKIENKVGAAFASSAFWAGGNETTIMSILQCMLIYGMIIVGDPMSATGHYGAASVAAPNEKDSEIAQKLGARVAELCKRLQS